MLRPLALAAALLAAAPAAAAPPAPVSLGPRPLFLVDAMAEGPLKSRLAACAGQPMQRSDFVIGHRGAPLMVPEHTRQSYLAAARTGAGLIECDVTFTKDKTLVCRHAQDDLARTTDILATPLAETCTTPFRPAKGARKARASCLTSDITLSEFRTLEGKMDGADPTARTPEAYMSGTPAWRTELYAPAGGTLMTHAESIALGRSLGLGFAPELKSPKAPMPFDGTTLRDLARALIADYEAAGVPPSKVFPQSFDLDVIRFWLSETPAWGANAVWLDGRYRDRRFDPQDPATWSPTMAELKAMGLTYLAPPLWVLLSQEDGGIRASAYARAARDAGLKTIAWSLERSGPLTDGGGWYHQTVAEAATSDGAVYEILDALVREAGVAKVFSDWPATPAYYANCMGLD